ncbi:MAG: DsbA family protein [Candidatus Colwellbacteria bacterium]|nr:DsbA family protein [Candidatus Colwellbacteria bacterium]
MKDDNFLAGSILAAALIVAGSLVYVFGPVRPNSPNLEANSLNPIGDSISVLPPFETVLPYGQAIGKEGEVILGDPNAPVSIVEYGDYQCPFCGRFFSTIEDKVRKDYIASGKAKMVYKDLIIIDSFISGGHESTDAALAVNCAAEGEKFWEYHDAVFAVEIGDGNKENSGNLTKEMFLNIAEKLGLDRTRFESCYDTRKYLSKVEADTSEAQKVLPRASTPSTFINGKLLQGAVSYTEFAAAIDEALGVKK